MALFEEFKPKLKPCRVHQEGHLIVIEELSSGRHYMLPSEAGPLVAAFDGTQSIKDIVSSAHKTGKPFQFKTLFNTIQQLDKAKFLANEGSPIHSTIERRGSLRLAYEKARTLDLSKVLIKSVQPNIRSQPVFLALVSLWILFAVVSALTGHFEEISNTFLQLHGSYYRGMLLYIAAGSVLLSAKTVVQSLLLLLASGRVFGLSLRISKLTAHLSVSDASIYLSKGRMIPALFHVASSLTVIGLVAVAGVFWSGVPWYGDLKTIALFLTLLELNPYYPSDLQKLLYLFQRDETRVHLVPYLKNRSLLSFLSKGEALAGEGAMLAYSAFAILWSAGTLYFLSTVMEKNCANLLLAAQSALFPDREGAVLILAAIGLHWVYFLADLGSTLLKNLYYPMSEQVDAWRRRARMRTESLDNPEAALEILARNPFFSSLDQATLHSILKRAKTRSYPGGTKLLIQGTLNKTLFAIIEGRVRVTKRAPSSAKQHVAVLGPSGVFGEISALGKGTTTADVVTLGRTLCLELDGEALEGLDVGRMMEQILVGHFVSSSSTFRNLPQEVVNLVMGRGTFCRVRPGEIIFEEGSIGKSLYLLVRGAVEVLHSGRKVRSLAQGDFFGEIAVMARVPRTATIRATEECTLLRLDSEAFWEILAENTQFSLFVESIAEMRERDSELLKAAA